QVNQSMQESARQFQQFMTMFAQYLPGIAAIAAAQQGVTLSTPAIAAQQHALQASQAPQAPQRANPLPTSEQNPARIGEQVPPLEPVVTQPSIPQAVSAGIQLGGPSAS